MYANNQTTNESTTTTTAITTKTESTPAPSPTPTPTKPPIHPALKSLWNIPHLVRIPDPLPPLDEIRNLIQARIAEISNQQHALHPSQPGFAGTQLSLKSDIALLENRLEELEKHFPTKEFPRSELNVAAQQPHAESKVSSGELLVSSAELAVSSGEPQLTSTESNSPSQHSPEPQPSPSPSHPAAELRPYIEAAALQPVVDARLHLSGRSPLHDLTPQQQETILLLLEDHPAWHVAKLIAPPAPEGFGLQTTDASINRFRASFIAAKCKAIRGRDENALADLLREAHTSDEAFQNATQHLLKDRIIRFAGERQIAVDSLETLITSLNKLRKQALAERKQAHAEKAKP